MGLVDYSESESDSEAPAPTPTEPISRPTQSHAPAATRLSTSSKKPFQKVVDRSNPGKIRVSLPQAKAEDGKLQEDKEEAEPPAKRARTGGGGGLFSGLNSFLPAPKNAGKVKAAAQSKSGGGGGTSRPLFQLKTSSEAGFSRDVPERSGEGDQEESAENAGAKLNLPPPKTGNQPSIPESMKAEEDVKLVGKPMMFRPLSVARGKKKPPKKSPASIPASTTQATESASKNESQGTETVAAATETKPAPPKKTSLFSLSTAESDADADSSSLSHGTTYEPLFESQSAPTAYDTAYASESSANAFQPVPTTAPIHSGGESLDTIANDLNLSAAERRQLFGRNGSSGRQQPGEAASLQASRVINFNMDREYQHNEDIRAQGQQQIHNPVRAIAPGKHSLQQLVNQVKNQRKALEDSFAKGKSNRKEASSRYGW